MRRVCAGYASGRPVVAGAQRRARGVTYSTTALTYCCGRHFALQFSVPAPTLVHDSHSDRGALTHMEFWSAISLIGSPVAMTALCVVLSTLLLWNRERRAATAAILIAGIGGLLNTALKDFVHRPRPPGAEKFLHGHSWSFPSGHAMGATIGFGMLAYCAVTYFPMSVVAQRLIIALCVLLAIAVGVSRVALGVHYRGDVIGGWLIGAAWLMIGITTLRRFERQHAAVAGVRPER